MNDQPASPPGLQVFEARIYFDPETGDVVSAHQVVGPPGDYLSSEQIQAETVDFEESIRQRYPAVDFIVVDPRELEGSGHGMKVDTKSKSIVYPENGDG